MKPKKRWCSWWETTHSGHSKRASHELFPGCSKTTHWKNLWSEYNSNMRVDFTSTVATIGCSLGTFTRKSDPYSPQTSGRDYHIALSNLRWTLGRFPRPVSIIFSVSNWPWQIFNKRTCEMCPQITWVPKSASLEIFARDDILGQQWSWLHVLARVFSYALEKGFMYVMSRVFSYALEKGFKTKKYQDSDSRGNIA